MQDNPTVKELTNADEFRKRANSGVQRNIRKNAHDFNLAFAAIGRVAGLEPGEIQAAAALDNLTYDKQSQDCETPRKVSLNEIGKALTSRKDTGKNKDAAWQKAQREVSNLFVHAYPRVGLAMQTREKGLNPNDGHEYTSRWGFVAGIVAEEFNAERGRILTSTTIKREDKGRAIGEALERLAAEALGLFDKLDVLIIENNKPFAVVTQAQAKAFSELKPQLFQGPKAPFRVAEYKYTPKPEPDKDAPYTLSRLDEIGGRMVTSAEKQFWTALEKTDLDTACKFIQDVKKDFDEMCARVVKVAGAADRHIENGTYKENIELSSIHENPHDGASADGDVILKNEYDNDDNPIEDSDLKNEIVGSVNFDTSLEAAISYVRDGWAIVPCRDKKPLIGGKIKNEGHTAASRDKGLITEWFTKTYKGAGVAIRLDGHVLIDVDVKDGAPGIESFDTLASTFDLPATLTAVTPSGGRHYIFKLPDSLPAGYLGNWTKFLESEGLGGIDIKTGVGGLCHVEPTRTAKGVYRWVDPTADIAEIPTALCEYFHNVHAQEQQAKLEEAQAKAAQYGSTSLPGTFDPDEDQTKYRVDKPNGQRRPRLRTVACALAVRGAGVEQIVEKLKIHDQGFTEPTNDFAYMLHVAQGAVTKFGQGVSQ